MQRLLTWLDDRTGYRELLKGALYEPIPGGARWRYVWGSTLVFVFIIQMITGICLWTAYSPSATSAWESVYFIQHEMTAGWIIRGIHHFAAQAMVILLILHLMQIVIDGAYRAPREVNFWLGLILMQIVLFLGLTGYLLPWDQKGYYATRVATGIIGSTPVVGSMLQYVLVGGNEYGHHTLTRFFALHAGILPGMLMAFVGLHLYVFRRHGIHVAKPRPGVTQQFWPDQVLKDAVACLAVLAAILTATWYYGGAELMAPANPGESFSAARPEWYYLFLFKFLSYEWVGNLGKITGLGEAFGGVVVPGVLMAILTLMPITAYFRWGHRFNVAYLWTIVGIAGVLTGVAIYDDWYSKSQKALDFRAAVKLAHRDAERIHVLASSPAGIPPEGAIVLLRDDPLTQGPVLFNTYCAGCHQSPNSTETYLEPATAPALADGLDREKILFGSRSWMHSVLVDFENHFATLQNIQGDFEEPAQAILTGMMKDWSEENREVLLDAENAADLKALIEFMYTQSQRPDALKPDDAVVLRGREIFETGAMTNGDLSSACIDCHAMHALTIVDGKIQLEEAAMAEELYPVLTGYGGTEWLKQFVSNPQEHYAGGDAGNNAMPSFQTQLSEHDLDMLARWLAYDYYMAKPQETAVTASEESSAETPTASAPDEQ